MVKNCLQRRRRGFEPWVGKLPWRRKWQPTPVLLPGESHGPRSLAGCSPWVNRHSHIKAECMYGKAHSCGAGSFVDLHPPSAGLHVKFRK